MKKIPSFWFTGTAVALLGVAIVRFVVPQIEASETVRLVVKVLGHLIAFVGIFFIARGISKSKSDSDDSE